MRSRPQQQALAVKNCGGYLHHAFLFCSRRAPLSCVFCSCTSGRSLRQRRREAAESIWSLPDVSLLDVLLKPFTSLHVCLLSLCLLTWLCRMIGCVVSLRKTTLTVGCHYLSVGSVTLLVCDEVPRLRSHCLN